MKNIVVLIIMIITVALISYTFVYIVAIAIAFIIGTSISTKEITLIWAVLLIFGIGKEDRHES